MPSALHLPVLRERQTVKPKKDETANRGNFIVRSRRDKESWIEGKKDGVYSEGGHAHLLYQPPVSRLLLRQVQNGEMREGWPRYLPAQIIFIGVNCILPPANDQRHKSNSSDLIIIMAHQVFVSVAIQKQALRRRGILLLFTKKRKAMPHLSAIHKYLEKLVFVYPTLFGHVFLPPVSRQAFY